MTLTACKKLQGPLFYNSIDSDIIVHVFYNNTVANIPIGSKSLSSEANDVYIVSISASREGNTFASLDENQSQVIRKKVKKDRHRVWIIENDNICAVSSRDIDLDSPGCEKASN